MRMSSYCSAKHPLAKIKKPTDKQLAEFPQIIMSNTVKSSVRSQGIINPHNVISVQDYLTKRGLLEAGLGWGRMPDHLVTEEIKKNSLVPLAVKSHSGHMHIAKLSSRELGPCGKFIWNYFSNGQKRTKK